MLSKYNYPDGLKKIAELGFNGAEISVLNKQFEIRDEFFVKENISKIKSVINELNGLKDISVSCHLDYVNKEEHFDTIIKTFPVAKELETDIVIINGAVSQAKTESEREHEWKKMIKKTRELCKIAENEDIKLAKEFEPGFITENTDQLIQVFKEVDSPSLFANLDLGHVFLCDPDPMEALESLQGKIIHGHIENMEKDVHDHLVPYMGDMDLKVYIQKLQEVGFDGPLALDLYDYDYEKVAKKSIDYLQEII